MALLDLLGRRWTLRVLWELRARTATFRELRELCDDVSPTVIVTDPSDPFVDNAPPVVPMLKTAPSGPVLPPAAPKDRLVAAIEAQNCVLTAANVETILIDAQLTQADLIALTPELAAEGRAEVAAEGTIRVLTANCI